MSPSLLSVMAVDMAIVSIAAEDKSIVRWFAGRLKA